MVAKTLYGLEEVLAGELQTIGANDLQIGRRMVSFTGDKELLYRANFCCRTALRILKPIYHFKAKDADTVYNEVKKVAWENYLSLDKTFAIDSVIYSEDFTHSKFVAYRTKDAIVDYFMEKMEKRPSVRVNNPDLYINIHISHNDCTLSIDSSGESLHKRGYRIDQTEAPLSEVLAAGMILKTGWKGDSNFVDPMCGSGTLLIEAAMIALNISPGVHRREYAFEKWMDFDQELFDQIYNDESRDREFTFKCYGSDISPTAIEAAEKNIRNAGLMKYVELKVQPFQQFTEAPQPGIMVTNPPYGERISSRDLLGLYSMIGERLKHVFTGYSAWILSYKDECFDKIGLRPSEKMKLMNGSLECEYRCFELFEGTNKDYKKALSESDEAGSAVKQVGDRKVVSTFEKRRDFRSDAKRDDFKKGDFKRGDFKKDDFRKDRGDRPDHGGLRRDKDDKTGDRPFRKREDNAGDRPFKRRDDSAEGRPFKRRDDSFGDRPFKKRDDSAGDRPFKKRADGGSSEGRKPFRRDEGGRDHSSFKKPFNKKGRDGGLRHND